jgi:hypothetical protein
VKRSVDAGQLLACCTSNPPTPSPPPGSPGLALELRVGIVQGSLLAVVGLVKALGANGKILCAVTAVTTRGAQAGIPSPQRACFFNLASCLMTVGPAVDSGHGR